MKSSIVGAVVAVAFAALLTAPVGPASAIVGGAPDAGEHPYVGQLLFFVPEAVDSRFDEPGAWYNCTGTLLDADTVVTAGHCTYGVGVHGEKPENPLHGGTDIWFSVAAAPDTSMLPPSSSYPRAGNEARYDTWSSRLDAHRGWSEAESTFTHPDYDDSEFFLHDVAVVELAEPITRSEYGVLPEENHLDRYYSKRAKQNGLFESVGYGLEGSSPKSSFGGDTRRKVDQRLVNFRGAQGLKNISVVFSHATGGTCSGDSGGPTFDISTPALARQNLIVAVTSYGLNDNCTAGGSYRVDQPDDLAFLADPAASYN